jgi:4'-phosphopantetheinyl transferase
MSTCVWRVPVSSAVPAGAREALSEEEQARAARFRHEADRLRYVQARGALRQLLSAECGAAPREIVIQTGAHGKPCVDGLRVSFNVSHAGDWVWIAVSRAPAVGVDIELATRRVLAPEVMERYASPQELAAWRACPEPQRTQAFFAWWTAKEAYLKGLGTGLSGPLRAVTVWTGELGPRRVGAWAVANLEAPRGYAAAVAVEAAELEVVLRDWRWHG